MDRVKFQRDFFFFFYPSIASEREPVASYKWWQNDWYFFLNKYVFLDFSQKPAVFELDEKMRKIGTVQKERSRDSERMQARIKTGKVANDREFNLEKKVADGFFP